MKRNYLICLLALIVISCSETKEEKSQAAFKITLLNQLDIERPDQPIVLSRQILEERLNEKSLQYVKLMDSTGKEIPVQFDDINSDGKWDEVALIYSFQPNQKLTLTITSSEKQPLFDIARRANVHLGYSAARNDTFEIVTDHIRPQDHKPQSTPMLYQYEGVGWENDKVGFRYYFDSRNGKDIFGKKVSSMVLDSVGLPGTDYHELNDWGMDVLKVGNSLGAGAVAMYKNGEFYAINTTDSSKFIQLSDGPIRAGFIIYHKGWLVGSLKYDVTEHITIWADHDYYQSTVTVTGQDTSFQIAAGITNLKCKSKPVTISENEFKAQFTYDAQSENGDGLGMGIAVQKNNFDNYREIATDPTARLASSYTTIFKKGGETFFFFTGWEQNGIVSKEAFEALIRLELKKLSSPIEIQ